MKKAILLLFFISVVCFSCKNEPDSNSSTEAEVPLKVEESAEKSEEVAQAAIEDTIEVYQPRPGELFSSPLKIEGRARGTWYFEGSFAIRLLDENGNKIAVVPAEAQDPWMTEDWVDFSTTLEFDAPASEEGFLVFEKANPSGKPEHSRELRVKIRYQAP